ncbi:MAG: hypothetical protein ABIR47_16980 [Candidatus Kapaibacterium sp.]
MIVTHTLSESGAPLYHIEYADGTTDDGVLQLPDIFASAGTREYDPVSYSAFNVSPEFQALQRELGFVMQNLKSFDTLIDSSAFQSLELPLIARRDFARSVLKRIGPAMKQYNPANYVGGRDTVKAWIEDYCSTALSEYWDAFHACDLPQYDFDGVREQIEVLENIDDRYDFVTDVLHEMAEPVGCMFVDTNAARHNRFSTSVWKIVFQYRHAISHEEYVLLLTIYKDLRLKHTQSIRQEVQSVDERDARGAANDRIGIDPIEWMAQQVDLVFVTDALKDAGYCRATDPVLVEHFEYGSAAKDKAKTFRDTRKKLREGASHPDRMRLEKLIQLLQAGLR